jgi:CubicO group peptidase (beta-lactamase class C family)
MHNTNGSSEQPLNTPFDQLREWFDARRQELEIPGAALGVIQGEVVEAIGLGVAHIATGNPVTTSTPFRVASLTKILTAGALAAVAERTDRSLHAPISAWYPGFTLADTEVAAHITMEQLLSHGAGWSDVTWADEVAADLTLDDVARDIASTTQVSAPGELFNYSNSSFMLAGHILALTTGLSYEEAVTKLILEPLAMNRSGFSQADFVELTIAPGHTTGDDGLKPTDPWEVAPAFNPAGGLVTTVEDLLRFVGFHAGIPSAGSYLSDDSRREMQEPHGPGGSLGPTIAESIGIGWMLAEADRHRVAMSFGSDSGAAAGMAVVTDAGFGVVVLTNADAGLLLATETIGKALTLFLGEALTTVTPVSVTEEELSSLVGTYAIPNDLTFEVRVAGGEAEIIASASDQEVSILSGPLEVLTPSIAVFAVHGMPVMIDFIRDEDGTVGWIRSFARLAPRVRHRGSA